MIPDALRVATRTSLFFFGFVSFSLGFMVDMFYQGLIIFVINSALQHWPHSQWSMYAPPQIDPLMLSFNGALVDHDERMNCGSTIAHS